MYDSTGLEAELKDANEREQLQKELCQSISMTSYFKNMRFTWFDTDGKDERQILDHLYADASSSIFGKVANNGWFSFLDGSDHHYKYKNAYQVRGHYSNREVMIEEYPMVLSCIVWVWPSGIGEYFVTKPYYISFPKLNVFDVGGRFLFLGDFSSDEVKLTLMAFATSPDQDNLLQSISFSNLLNR